MGDAWLLQQPALQTHPSHFVPKSRYGLQCNLITTRNFFCLFVPLALQSGLAAIVVAGLAYFFFFLVGNHNHYRHSLLLFFLAATYSIWRMT